MKGANLACAPRIREMSHYHGSISHPVGSFEYQIEELDLGVFKFATIHFSISFAPINVPAMPNAINHQVSMPMPNRIAKTLITVKPNPNQILVLSLLLDRRIAT